MSQYLKVVIQTYVAQGERSPRPIRARPVPRQGLDPSMNVERSETMRNRHPPGSFLLIKAKITKREGGPPFLNSYYGWKYELLTKAQVDRIIPKRN